MSSTVYMVLLVFIFFFIIHKDIGKDQLLNEALKATFFIIIFKLLFKKPKRSSTLQQVHKSSRQQVN